MKNTLNEEKLKAEFTDEEKTTIEACSAEGLQWLEGNQDAEGMPSRANKRSSRLNSTQ